MSMVPGCQANITPTRMAARDCRSLPPANRLSAASHSASTDTVYTILIRLPPVDGEMEAPSIKMIPEERPMTAAPRHDGNQFFSMFELYFSLIGLFQLDTLSFSIRSSEILMVNI